MFQFVPSVAAILAQFAKRPKILVGSVEDILCLVAGD